MLVTEAGQKRIENVSGNISGWTHDLREGAMIDNGVY
jgi:hypothetical protein